MNLNRLIETVLHNKVFWAIIGALLVVNLIFYVTFVRSQHGTADQLHRAYMQKEKAGVGKSDLEIQQHLKMAEGIETFRKIVGNSNQFSQRISDLHTILQRQDISQSKMIFEPSSVDQLELLKYTTSFTVSGSYQSLRRLLADIQNSSSLHCIESISLSSKTPDADDVTMALKIATYFTET
jgi:hypothetical protein